MMRPQFLIARKALAMMSARLVAMQAALALLVFVLAVFWLRLPESSALSLVFTVFVAVLLLAIAGGGEVAIMLRLCGKPRTLGRLLKGAGLLLVGVALWFVWSALIDYLRMNDSTLAGYLNSRFPASLRNIFSYSHLYRWLEWIFSALAWIGAGVLAVFVFSTTASERPLSAVRSALLSGTFWLSLVGASLVAPTLTSLLMGWTPGHSLGIEMFSLIVRLGVVVVLDTVLAVAVLAVLAACILHSDLRYATPAGGPDTSQPRTDEAP